MFSVIWYESLVGTSGRTINYSDRKVGGRDDDDDAKDPNVGLVDDFFFFHRTRTTSEWER